MPQYKLLCKKKTVCHDVGTIAKVSGPKEYWLDFCNIHSDTWEFLGEEDSTESFPVKPIVPKSIRKYLNRKESIAT